MSASERRIAELERQITKLKRLLSQQMRTGEDLEVTAIVTREGEPKFQVRWDQLAAEMPVEEGRDLAFQILRACEWAETDATMLKVLREAFDEKTAAGFMGVMREARGGEEDRSA